MCMCERERESVCVFLRLRTGSTVGQWGVCVKEKGEGGETPTLQQATGAKMTNVALI